MNIRKLEILGVLALALIVAPLIQIAGGPSLMETRSAQAFNTEANPMGTNRIVEVVKAKNSAVVGVQAVVKAKPARGPVPHNPGFPFRQQQPQPPRPEGGMGSGFVISPDGLVLTNNHVVEQAESIKVQWHDGKEYEAKVLGTDPKTDIALLKLIRDANDTEPLPYLKMGDSGKLEVGSWVIAIGNPFGLSHTVTTGIVSAKGRNIGAGPYDEFIQTDASINPGNSGGPLLNLNGDVIGINTMIISGTGGNVGIGFAIPINIAKKIVNDLKDYGTVTRGWLGVMIQKLTPELAESFGLVEAHGVLINEVMANGPAHKGGLLRGDVIVAFNGKKVDMLTALPKLVADTRPGETVDIDVIRDGKTETIRVTIEKMNDSKA